MALASISTSFILGGLHLSSVVHVQFWEGYVLKFCILLFWLYLRDLCMHIQFLKDICTSMVVMLYGKLALRASLTCMGSSWLTRKSLMIYDPLRKWLTREFVLMILTHKGVFLVILALLEKITGNLWIFWSTGRKSSSRNSRGSYLGNFGPTGKSLRILIH